MLKAMSEKLSNIQEISFDKALNSNVFSLIKKKGDSNSRRSFKTLVRIEFQLLQIQNLEATKDSIFIYNIT